MKGLTVSSLKAHFTMFLGLSLLFPTIIWPFNLQACCDRHSASSRDTFAQISEAPQSAGQDCRFS